MIRAFKSSVDDLVEFVSDSKPPSPYVERDDFVEERVEELEKEEEAAITRVKSSEDGRGLIWHGTQISLTCASAI